MSDDESFKNVPFKDMGLDNRILEAISTLKWEEPTPIQEVAIPLALEGKDILARARTGSGKTAAFAIPIIQKILQLKKQSSEQEINALILAPSKELCKQIYKSILALCSYCSRDVSCVDLSGKVDLVAQRPLLVEKPDIVVGTPSRVLAHLKAMNMILQNSLKMVVIDEADLVFSFGCGADVKEILKYLPQIYQAFLMSATLSSDVQEIKKLVLCNPVTLRLRDEAELPQSSQLTQYHIKCEEEDKFVLIYALFKLGLIKGKSLIFVNSVDRCYRLKLYLEQFGIKNCVLNAELPVDSRTHIVNQFDAGVYDIIIASDEKSADNPTKRSKKSNKRLRKDKEYGVSRGIDFQFVSNVINFDFPPDVEAYIHRVGRTARGNNHGTALSFVSMKEMALMEALEAHFAGSHEEQEGSIFKPYLFKMEDLESFRYRARDAFRAVTRIAVREARLKEIKVELLNSRKLKPYFEDNPRDLQLLRHDKSLHVVKLGSHLKNVPDYIVPPTLKNLARVNNKPSHNSQKRNSTTFSTNKTTKSQRKFKRKKKNPLKNFQFEGLAALETKKEEMIQ